jgi:hypothetical protein
LVAVEEMATCFPSNPPKFEVKDCSNGQWKNVKDVRVSGIECSDLKDSGVQELNEELSENNPIDFDPCARPHLDVLCEYEIADIIYSSDAVSQNHSDMESKGDSSCGVESWGVFAIHDGEGSVESNRCVPLPQMPADQSNIDTGNTPIHSICPLCSMNIAKKGSMQCQCLSNFGNGPESLQKDLWENCYNMDGEGMHDMHDPKKIVTLSDSTQIRITILIKPRFLALAESDCL